VGLSLTPTTQEAADVAAQVSIVIALSVVVLRCVAAVFSLIPSVRNGVRRRVQEFRRQHVVAFGVAQAEALDNVLLDALPPQDDGASDDFQPILQTNAMAKPIPDAQTQEVRQERDAVVNASTIVSRGEDCINDEKRHRIRSDSLPLYHHRRNDVLDDSVASEDGTVPCSPWVKHFLIDDLMGDHAASPPLVIAAAAVDAQHQDTTTGAGCESALVDQDDQRSQARRALL
jgi:hypothetical protein